LIAIAKSGFTVQVNIKEVIICSDHLGFVKESTSSISKNFSIHFNELGRNTMKRIVNVIIMLIVYSFEI
jgi:hypothetical protein